MRKIMKKHVFRMCKIMQIYYAVVEKRSFARSVRERKIIKKTLEMISKSMVESVENLYKYHAPKSDAK